MRGNLLSDTILFIAAAGYEQKALGTHFNLDCHLKTFQQTIPFSLSNLNGSSKKRVCSVSVPQSPVESENAPPSGLVIWCCVNWFNCCSRMLVRKRALTVQVKDENRPVKRSHLRHLRGGGCLSRFGFLEDVMRIRLVYPPNKEHFHRSTVCYSLHLGSFSSETSSPI